MRSLNPLTPDDMQDDPRTTMKYTGIDKSKIPTQILHSTGSWQNGAKIRDAEVMLMKIGFTIQTLKGLRR